MKFPLIIVAATIGEGIFALPYIFQNAGWLTTLIYLGVLSGVVITAHIVYLKTLAQTHEKKRLLGLAREYFGETGFWIGFVALIIGLGLPLVGYLILGPRFIELAIPSFSPALAFAIFWVAISLPVLVSNPRAVRLEIFGVTLVGLIVVFVFANGIAAQTWNPIPAINFQNAFLPFGIILLSLAGWPGVEPLYESAKRAGKLSRAPAYIASGTAIAAGLYILFITGIFGSAGHITADTISGLTNWPRWERILIAALGIFSIGTGSIPITHEIRNAFEKDLGWHPVITRSLIIFLPPLIILAGFTSFIGILSLAGGCFIALQYLLIIAVGRRTLTLSSSKKLGLDIVAFAFIAAAIYQVWFSVVK